jgi:NitT/TauT family transport system permease protein
MKFWRRRATALVNVLLALLFLTGWEAAVWFFDIPAIVIPAPSAVFAALETGLTNGEIGAHLLVTFGEIILGFASGAAFGLISGAAIGLFPILERTIYPYLVAFQTVPKVAIAPIIVVWFGYGMASKIVITATIAFFPALANTVMGLRAAPREQIELLIALTASRWQIFRWVRFPNALPYVFVGLDVAIVLAVIGAIVGEFVGAQAGLGYLILQREFNLDMAGVFALLVVLSALGIGLHWTVTLMQRRIVFWLDDGGDRTIGA